MAECANCGTETQPGDLVTRLVDEKWQHFCSEGCYTSFREAGPQPAEDADAPVTAEPVSPPPRVAPKRRSAKGKSAS